MQLIEIYIWILDIYILFYSGYLGSDTEIFLCQVFISMVRFIKEVLHKKEVMKKIAVHHAFLITDDKILIYIILINIILPGC